MLRVIFHIDMDSFFVSCERSKNEKLQNKPIIIAQNSKRAIATAMSYEVKNLGFKVGDAFYTIKDKIKDLIVIEPHYQLYSLTSKKIFKYIENHFSSNIEIYSIDECYIDVTDKIKQYNTAYELAKKIQTEILEVFKIPCSIGISYTKFLAKMSTNQAKPFGILETKKENIKEHFYALPIKKIFGIGKGILLKLNQNNINTYEDLINYKNEFILRDIFGKNYCLYIQELKGENISSQHTLKNNIVKSISNSKTFMNEDSNDENFLLTELKEIVFNISERAKDQNLVGKNISLLIRKQNKIWIQKNKILPEFTNDFNILWKTVSFLFEEIWDDKKLRGLGIALSSLKSEFDTNVKINLFDATTDSKVNTIINNQNFYYGKNSLKTLEQYQRETQKNIENIRFLRKNTKEYNKRINLEENKWK